VRQSGAVGFWLELGIVPAVLGAGVDASPGVTTDGAYVQEGAALDIHPARRSATGKSGRRRLMYNTLLSEASATQGSLTRHGAGEHRHRGMIQVALLFLIVQGPVRPRVVSLTWSLGSR